MPAPLDLSQLESAVYAVAQTMPRIVAVFAVMPFFSGQSLPGMARAAFILILAIFMAPGSGPAVAPGVANWVFIAGKEAMLGMMLGLGFGVLIWAVQSMGDLIDLQVGTSNAQFFDPVGGHEGGRTGEFLGWLVMTLFISTGGLLSLIGALVDSFRLWPVATFLPQLGRVLELFALREGDALFSWIVKLAAPIVFVLMLADVGLGLVGRAAPQLNLFAFTQPVKSLLAVLMLLLLQFYLFDSLQNFLAPDNGVLQFLRSAL
jgi:type III secretion protein T